MKKPSKILYFGKKALAFLLSVLVLSLAVFYVSRLAPGTRSCPTTATARRN